MNRWENNQQRNKIVCYSWARPMQVLNSERKVDFAFFYWMIMRSSEDKAGRRWRERERDKETSRAQKLTWSVYEIGKCVLDIDRRFWTNTSSAQKEGRDKFSICECDEFKFEAEPKSKTKETWYREKKKKITNTKRAETMIHMWAIYRCRWLRRLVCVSERRWKIPMNVCVCLSVFCSFVFEGKKMYMD